MPCAPLVEAEDLRGAYDAYARTRREIPLLAVVSFPYPVERALALDSEVVLRPKYPHSWHARSQNLAPAYHDAGLSSLDRQSVGVGKSGSVRVDRGGGRIMTEKDAISKL